MGKVCSLWSTENVQWKNANWTWDECFLVSEIITQNSLGVDATTLLQPWIEEETWNPYRAGEIKRKKLIKLICKVSGKTYDFEKSSKEVKITVENIKMVVKAVSGIELKIKE